MVTQLAAMLAELKDFPLESPEAEADFILMHLVDTYGMKPPVTNYLDFTSQEMDGVILLQWEPEDAE